MRKIILLRTISILFLGAFATPSYGQHDFKKTYDFLQHLNKIEAYEEGIYVIDEQLERHSAPQLDSLYYLKGYFNYSMKEISPSIASFNKVTSSASEIFIRAQFFMAFQNAYIGRLAEAKMLASVDLDNSSFLNELKALQLASVSLLERDYQGFEKYAQSFSGDYYQLSNTEDRLRLNKEGLLKARNKSPFVAGLLSGVLPGAGKFYVGKAGEGYLTFLISTILGLQVREAYKKDGIESTRFKLYSSLFGAIYIANIWGSAVAVKVYRNEINDTYDEAILLNMHVPLRTIFN